MPHLPLPSELYVIKDTEFTVYSMKYADCSVKFCFGYLMWSFDLFTHNIQEWFCGIAAISDVDLKG